MSHDYILIDYIVSALQIEGVSDTCRYSILTW